MLRKRVKTITTWLKDVLSRNFNNPKEKPWECRTVILRYAEKETTDYTQQKNILFVKETTVMESYFEVPVVLGLSCAVNYFVDWLID
jgi:hypothetical protein